MVSLLWQAKNELLSESKLKNYNKKHKPSKSKQNCKRSNYARRMNQSTS